MCKFPLALVAVPAVLFALAMGAVAQTAPPDLPMAIMCYNQKAKIWVVGYLYMVKENGDATYSGAMGRLTATLNAKGVLEPPADRTPGLDCYGQTLDQLRSKGRVIEFQRPR